MNELVWILAAALVVGALVYVALERGGSAVFAEPAGPTRIRLPRGKGRCRRNPAWRFGGGR